MIGSDSLEPKTGEHYLGQMINKVRLQYNKKDGKTSTACIFHIIYYTYQECKDPEVCSSSGKHPWVKGDLESTPLTQVESVAGVLSVHFLT